MEMAAQQKIEQSYNGALIVVHSGRCQIWQPYRDKKEH